MDGLIEVDYVLWKGNELIYLFREGGMFGLLDLEYPV